MPLAKPFPPPVSDCSVDPFAVYSLLNRKNKLVSLCGDSRFWQFIPGKSQDIFPLPVTNMDDGTDLALNITLPVT